jgi:hypothetical protein
MPPKDEAPGSTTGGFSETSTRMTVSHNAARGSSRRWPAICSRCLRLLDLPAIEARIRVGELVRHDCGKVLSRGAT